jgi:glycosyltransferase involved in cell wall biosynthesis
LRLVKALFINRVYPPAEGATGFLLQELAEALVAAGHQVTIITSALAASGTSIPSAQKSGLENCPGQSKNGSVEVLRVAGLPFTRASHLKRALAYLSLYPAFLLRAMRVRKPDVIITMTDPPLQLALGPMLKMFKRCKLAHWAQDVYPELAEELGVLPRNGIVGRFLRAVSTLSLKRCDAVIAVGRCMKQRLEQRGVPGAKITVIPNWAQEGGGSAPDLPVKIERFRQSLGLHDKFVVMYSGNFGLAHDFRAILEAVPALEKTSPDIHFLFAGGGPKYASIQESLRSRGNVSFLPFQPKEMLDVSLGAGDAHLVSMQENLRGLVVPSKLYGVMAAGKPCVFVGPEDCEAALFLRENQCGVTVPPSDGAKLAAVLTEMRQNPQRCEEAREKVAFAKVFESFLAVLEKQGA